MIVIHSDVIDVIIYELFEYIRNYVKFWLYRLALAPVCFATQYIWLNSEYIRTTHIATYCVIFECIQGFPSPLFDHIFFLSFCAYRTIKTVESYYDRIVVDIFFLICRLSLYR